MKNLQTLQRYDAYRDSGVEWFGEVPAHWDVIRNKDIFHERGSLSQSGDETLLTVSHITGVTRRSEKNVNMFMAETMEGYKHCKTGDLIINTMWAWMGALGTAREDGICSPAYGVYAPRKGMPYNHGYFDYLYRISKAVSEMTRNSKGIVSSRLRLYPKDFFQILTALPSYKEQTAIVAYLDKKTTQIDRKIDLLSQKATQYGKLKQSLINETVTHGLDKSVPMKESNVEGIGNIPEHWKIKHLKSLAEIKGGKDSSHVEVEEGGYPIYGSGGIFGRSSKYLHNKPSVLLGRKGTIDKPLFVTEPFWSVDTMFYTDIKKSVEPKFFYYKCLTIQFGLYQYGSAVPSMASTVLNRILFALPPLPEQKAIAAYLDEKTTQIDRITTTINNQINKLKELRKALINDVVTGKIKVPTL
ncbi:MAG: restriction endonuclease subunit S [Candidatus Electrothrix communis]|nr:MAG: restriction endonuclease subunit S [Candidatus Electrothrix communis]